ncbi:uncharacterized protein LOC144560736 [Carex rostrata]
MQIFLLRVMIVGIQIRAYGDNILEQTMVEKVLRNVAPKFDHMVAAIEESGDLSTYSFDELMGSLQTHEAKFRSKEKDDEKAFYRKGESSQCRGGRGHCRFGEFLFQHDIEDVQSFHCKRYGCVQADCFRKQREEQQACCQEEKKEQPILFMAYTACGRQRSTIFEEMAENKKLASSNARRNNSSKNNGDQKNRRLKF